MYFYKYIEDGALESQLFPKENRPENVVEITEEEYIAELEKKLMAQLEDDTVIHVEF